LISMMLALSLVLGILPLLGIAWTVMNGLITTVDGLFMTLILLTLSGVFMLNAYWEMRDSGMIKKKVAVPAVKAPATKAS
jgi:predicted RND superfamily exporter protein